MSNPGRIELFIRFVNPDSLDHSTSHAECQFTEEIKADAFHDLVFVDVWSVLKYRVAGNLNNFFAHMEKEKSN